MSAEDVRTSNMKIIEALKEIKLIEKKIEENGKLVFKYSSQPDNIKLPFETEEQQKKEIRNLDQSTKDLIENMIILNKRISITNLKVQVEINGETRSIQEWILYRRKIYTLYMNFYENMKVGRFTVEKDVKINTFFDERSKVDSIRRIEDTYHHIDRRLEVINATTDLLIYE